MRRLATETEVEWHEACDGYIISGTFEQLQNAYEQLNRYKLYYSRHTIDLKPASQWLSGCVCDMLP